MARTYEHSEVWQGMRNSYSKVNTKSQDLHERSLNAPAFIKAIDSQAEVQTFGEGTETWTREEMVFVKQAEKFYFCNKRLLGGRNVSLKTKLSSDTSIKDIGSSPHPDLMQFLVKNFAKLQRYLNKKAGKDIFTTQERRETEFALKSFFDYIDNNSSGYKGFSNSIITDYDERVDGVSPIKTSSSNIFQQRNKKAADPENEMKEKLSSVEKVRIYWNNINKSIEKFKKKEAEHIGKSFDVREVMETITKKKRPDLPSPTYTTPPEMTSMIKYKLSSPSCLSKILTQSNARTSHQKTLKTFFSPTHSSVNILNFPDNSHWTKQSFQGSFVIKSQKSREKQNNAEGVKSGEKLRQKNGGQGPVRVSPFDPSMGSEVTRTQPTQQSSIPDLRRRSNVTTLASETVGLKGVTLSTAFKSSIPSVHFS